MYTFFLCLAVVLCPLTRAGAMQVTFMARLANFEGVVPSLWAKIALDRERKEIIVLNPRKRDIRIFNEAGMQIYTIGDNVEVSGATDIDVDENGNIYLVFPRARNHKIIKLDYKGKFIAALEMENLPEDFSSFSPRFIQYLDGELFLADAASLNVVVTDARGNFQKGYHLKDAIMQLEDDFSDPNKEKAAETQDPFEDLGLSGFCVDRHKNIYFTIASRFSAFKLPADGGELRVFGTSGSGPGKFGVVAGIATDSQGNIYVTDRLRSVVIIFDGNFSFVTEFGFRGDYPGSLMVPDDIIVDDRRGRIYVAQAANRGVSIFKIITD